MATIKYTIETTQTFNVTYDVLADSPENAWRTLVETNDAECVNQTPDEITGTFLDANIEETP